MTTLVSLQSHIAHEIRNYLDCLNMTLEQLHRKFSEDVESRKQFSILKTSCDNIEKLVWALNDVNCAPRMKRVNLVELLWEQISLLESFMESKNINFQCQLGTDPIFVHGDPHQLGRCFLNFIKNAFEACREGDMIKITARMENNVALIKIQDSGEGMTPEVQESLFTPFFTSKESGTGIGAYIAKTIIEKHDGCVEVDSECGRGTTITISLPVREGELCTPKKKSVAGGVDCCK